MVPHGRYRGRVARPEARYAPVELSPLSLVANAIAAVMLALVLLIAVTPAMPVYGPYLTMGRHRHGAAEQITSLTSANSAANFLTAVADMTINVIELAAGNYNWQAVVVPTDRTARPLTIRPALGATLNFIGPASSNGIIFQIGDGTHTPKWITFDGHDRLGGGAWVFKDFLLAQSGVFEPRGSDHITLRNLTFQNLDRDAGFTTNPNQSWIMYASGAGTGFNDNLVVENCLLSAPATSKNISAFAIQSSGTFGTVTIRNITGMTNYDFGLYCERQIANIDVHDWTMVNVRDPAGPYSMRLASAAVSMAGAIYNITGTGGCGPYGDGHTGGGVVTTSNISLA